MGSQELTVLAGDVATHGGVVHLAGGGEGEDVRGARHAPGGRGGAVAQTELVEVQPDLTDVVSLPLDEVDAGPARRVGGGEAGVLQLGDVGGDDSTAGDQPHHTAGPEPTGTTPLRLTTLEIFCNFPVKIFRLRLTWFTELSPAQQKYEIKGHSKVISMFKIHLYCRKIFLSFKFEFKLPLLKFL